MAGKKENERWILNLFIENYKKDEITVLREQESPDFIISINDRVIGLELTEIFQDSHTGNSKLKQNSSDGGSFTEELIYLIQPNIPFNFSIGITFNQNFPIGKSKKPVILKALAEICLLKMINLNDYEHLNLENYYNSLPIEINNIYISRIDAMDRSIDSRPEGGPVSRLTINHLNSILRSKESKLPLYSKCNEYWLLIREGNYYSGSFSEIEIDLPIESHFNKIFLLRTRTIEIIELK